MGGGGGMLDKMIPGYQNIIWSRLHPTVKRIIIQRQHASFNKELESVCVSGNQKVRRFSEMIAPLASDYGSRNPTVDYKRQFARGTFLEGRDVYLPTPSAQQRLYNVFQPYTDEERAEREKYSRYNLKATCAFLVAGFLVYDYKQSRPIAWCVRVHPIPPRQAWYFKHVKHSHDVMSVRRGWEVFRQVCSTCHSIKKNKWWYLMKDVYPVRRVQEFAAERTMVDGLTDDGELNIRPCATWDFFPPAFPTEEAAKEANNGKEPPDFSVGPTYYHGGNDYFFGVLTGYKDPPVGIKVPEGAYYNVWYPGGVIAMPPPLEDGLVDYEDGTVATVSQMAKDVCNFLTFQAEPYHDERKLLGLKGSTGLFVSILFFWVARRFCWSGTNSRRVDFGKLRYL